MLTIVTLLSIGLFVISISSSTGKAEVTSPELVNLENADPTITYNVVISLKKLTSLDKAINDFAKNPNITVTGFDHACYVENSCFIGGYMLPEKYIDMEDIKEQYYNEYLYFLNKNIQITQKLIELEENAKTIKAHTALLNQLKQRKTDFIDKGIQIYGVRVKGKAPDLINLTKQKEFISKVEVLDNPKQASQPMLPDCE